MLFCLVQVRGSDSCSYYSCDDHFVVPDNAADIGHDRSGSSRTSPRGAGDQMHPSGKTAPNWNQLILVSVIS